MEKTFSLYLSVHWGDLIEQIKKICHIHFKETDLMCTKKNKFIKTIECERECILEISYCC